MELRNPQGRASGIQPIEIKRPNKTKEEAPYQG